jgi:hypothetical protein
MGEAESCAFPGQCLDAKINPQMANYVVDTQVANGEQPSVVEPQSPRESQVIEISPCPVGRLVPKRGAGLSLDSPDAISERRVQPPFEIGPGLNEQFAVAAPLLHEVLPNVAAGEERIILLG